MHRIIALEPDYLYGGLIGFLEFFIAEYLVLRLANLKIILKKQSFLPRLFWKQSPNVRILLSKSRKQKFISKSA